jgi:hypothetical protein
MKHGLHFSSAGADGSVQRKEFERELFQNLSHASGLPPANFKVKHMSPGSIVIDTEITPNPSGNFPDPDMVAKDLERQLHDINSALRSGSITCFAESIVIQGLQPTLTEMAQERDDMAAQLGQAKELLAQSSAHIRELQDDLEVMQRGALYRDAHIQDLEQGAQVLGKGERQRVLEIQDLKELLQNKDLEVHEAQQHFRAEQEAAHCFASECDLAVREVCLRTIPHLCSSVHAHAHVCAHMCACAVLGAMNAHAGTRAERRSQGPAPQLAGAG